MPAVLNKSVVKAPRPAFKVGSFDEAIAHYVDWLGFQLDWEWREAPGEPVIAALSRDDCVFMINEHIDASGPASLHMDVSNLDALIEEWSARRPGSITVQIAQPFEFPQVVVEDPWGNVLHFEGKDDAANQ